MSKVGEGFNARGRSLKIKLYSDPVFAENFPPCPPICIPKTIIQWGVTL